MSTYKLLVDFPDVSAGEVFTLDVSDPKRPVYRPSVSVSTLQIDPAKVEQSPDLFVEVAVKQEDSTYYYVSETGVVLSLVDKGTDEDLARHQVGNYYSDQKTADDRQQHVIAAYIGKI